MSSTGSGAGYFDRLVDRALGRVPVLTPRRGARFEPVAPQPVSDWGETLEPLGSSAHSSPTVPTVPYEAPRRDAFERGPRTPTVAPPSALRTLPGSFVHEVRERRTIEVREPAAPLPPETRLHTVSIQPPVAVRRPDSVSVTPPAIAPRVSNPEPAATPARRSETLAEPPWPGGAGPVMERLDRLEDALNGPGTDASPAVAADRPSVPAPPPPAAARTVPAYDVRHAAPPALTGLPRTEPAPAAETTVHITIGRVDVHAHTERSSTSARARTPRLGLDDYLRRREGA